MAARARAIALESALARTTDSERDEALVANRGGLSFLLVHGLTWLIAAALSFALPLKLAALVYLFQGFVALPASLVLERLLGFGRSRRRRTHSSGCSC